MKTDFLSNLITTRQHLGQAQKKNPSFLNTFRLIHIYARPFVYTKKTFSFLPALENSIKYDTIL